jgi:thiamine biosynthesis protein ThiI
MTEIEILKQYNLILVRYGEIWLKSQKVKIRMLKVLMNNIKYMLNRNEIPFHKYQLSKDSSRIFFFFNNQYLIRAINILKDVFGIYSISPALRTSSKLKNISERAIEVAKDFFQKNDTFALRVRRSGKHNFSSLEIAKIVGQAILDDMKDWNLKVDLTNPRKKIFIEVRGEFSYIFTQIIRNNWGGLPIEISKKVLVMDIGRMNDIIAGFLLMRRGCVIYPIMFENINNQNSFKNWVSNWEKVRKYFPLKKFKLLKVDLFFILERIYEQIEDKRYFCSICRLIRFNILARLLNNSKQLGLEKSAGITDGTSLNKSTFCPDDIDLESLSINYLFSYYPIFTPNIGSSLERLTEQSNRISTELKKIDYCYFKPKNQEFNKEKLKEIYFSLKLDDLISNCIENIEEIKLL